LQISATLDVYCNPKTRFESRWGRQSKLARTLIFLRRDRPSGFSDHGFSASDDLFVAPAARSTGIGALLEEVRVDGATLDS
jgi:hypothetical protein